MKKRILTLLLVAMMVFTMIPITASATEIVDSGKCGDDLTWTIDDNGLLTISGTGEMWDYSDVLDESPFSYRDITTIVINEGVSSIGGGMFFGCYNLKNITIPNSTTSIGFGAFCACESLTSITIPSGVTSIDSYAFEDCINLTSVTIPDSVTSIGSSPFDSCVSLTSINVDNNNKCYSSKSGILFNKNQTELINYPAGKAGAYTIPDRVTSIGDGAFSGCNSLTSISIPNSVTSIGDGAFSGCNSLTSISIPNSVTSIGGYAFSYCDSLTSITIPDSVTSIEYGTFKFCEKLISITIPNSVTSIDGQAFEYCASLTNIIIPDSVTSIGKYAFNHCDSLTSITVPDSVASIEHATFVNCKKLASISISENVTDIGDYAFTYCESLTDVYYGGFQSDWNKISIGDHNDELLNATIHYHQHSYTSKKTEATCESKGYTTYTCSCGDTYKDDCVNALDHNYVDGVCSRCGKTSGGNSSSDPTDIDISLDYIARQKWINQHIEYATSESYKSQIVRGFSGALDEALNDIIDNGEIKAYNTLDSVNSVLGFDLDDIDDTQEYELLLAQILFSRNGVTSIEEIYYDSLTDTIIEMGGAILTVHKNNGMLEKYGQTLKTVLDKINSLEYGDDGYEEAINEFFNLMDQYDSLDIVKEFTDACKGAGMGFVNDVATDTFKTMNKSFKELAMYIAAGEAYCKTSDAFVSLLRIMQQNIEAPVSNTGLILLPNFGGTDPLNTPIVPSQLAKAIDNFCTAIESYKATGCAEDIASNVLEGFIGDSADMLLNNSLNTALSLFECLPVVKEFTAIRALFSGTQFAIDTFTGIDDRAYLGTMIMRLYYMSVIHYATVDSLAQNANVWGKTSGTALTAESFDEKIQYEMSLMFDESVNIYRSILDLAAEYAKEYYATYLNSKIIAPTQKQAISSTILKLQSQQKRDIVGIRCHPSETGVTVTLDTDKFKIFTFTCPIDVTVTNEAGEEIAFLSNNGNRIVPGYEAYCFTTETESGSGDYIKIALMPETYTVTLSASDVGTMNAYVATYTDGVLGETEAYLDVPLTESSVGCFASNTGNAESNDLILGDVAYHAAENPDEIPEDSDDTAEDTTETFVEDDTDTTAADTLEDTDIETTDTTNDFASNSPDYGWIIACVIVAISIAGEIVFFVVKKNSPTDTSDNEKTE